MPLPYAITASIWVGVLAGLIEGRWAYAAFGAMLAIVATVLCVVVRHWYE